MKYYKWRDVLIVWGILYVLHVSLCLWLNIGALGSFAFALGWGAVFWFVVFSIDSKSHAEKILLEMQLAELKSQEEFVDKCDKLPKCNRCGSVILGSLALGGVCDWCFLSITYKSEMKMLHVESKVIDDE